MDGLNILLGDGFNGHEPHVGARNRFVDCLRVVSIVFMAFNIRFNKLGAINLTVCPCFVTLLPNNANHHKLQGQSNKAVAF
jgi:hypothetical protein